MHTIYWLSSAFALEAASHVAHVRRNYYIILTKKMLYQH